MCKKGRFIVFEGVDGAGKTLLANSLKDDLLAKGERVMYLSFPGRGEGTLGWHIYQLHERPEIYGVNSVHPLSLQLLHIAAHIDTIENILKPELYKGTTVILDRYWWSTYVYGKASGIDSKCISKVIDVEKELLKGFEPDVCFYIYREEGMNSKISRNLALKLNSIYRDLIVGFENVVLVDNSQGIDETLFFIKSECDSL